MDPNSLKDDNQSLPDSHVVVLPPADEPVIPPTPNSTDSLNSAPPLANPINPSAPVLPPGVDAIPAQQVPPIPSVFSQQALDNSQTPPPPPSSDDQSFQNLPKKRKINGKTASILVALLIVAAIPLTVFLSNQQQTVQNHASGANLLTSNPVVANFDKKPYRISDLLTTAEQNYSQDQIETSNSNDQKDLFKTVRDIFIERKILDKAALDLGVSASQEDTAALRTSQDLSDDEARYAVLKQQITLKKVKSLRAISIGFWYPPVDSLSLDDGPIVDQKAKINLSLKALADIQTDLQQGMDPVAIVNSIRSDLKYATIKDDIGLNGNLVSTVEVDLSSIAGPQLFEYGDVNLNTTDLNKLFSLNAGDIWTSSPSDSNSSGYVYKVFDKGTGSSFSTYDDWYNAQQSSLVKILSSDPL